MKLDINVLKKLSSVYAAISIDQDKNIKNFIFSGQSERAPKEFDDILGNGGFEWSDITKNYSMGDQKIYYSAPQSMFIWVWASIIIRGIKGAKSLSQWVSGSDKYPEGKSTNFIKTYLGMVNGNLDRGEGGSDIEFDGSGERSADYKSEPLAPDDILIAQFKKKMGNGFRLPTDDIIDLYNKAKELKSNKLMTFVKSIKPLNENSINKSTLEEIIKEIVKGIVSEGFGSYTNASTSKMKSDNEFAANTIAKKLWKDMWFVRSKSGEHGTVYQYKIRDTSINRGTRFIWKDMTGNYKVLDTTTKKWNPIQSEPVQEETGTSAVSPISTPFAFKKKTTMEGWRMSTDPLNFPPDGIRLCPICNYKGYKHKPESPYNYCDSGHAWRADTGDIIMAGDNSNISEMTDTGGVSGYNVPAAFSSRGGSEAAVDVSKRLGFQITPQGEEDMERKADKLY